MKSSLEIAQEAKIQLISDIAENIGLKTSEIELHGSYIAKIKFHEVLNRIPERRKDSKYILVTGMTPTPFGEGKTVHTIGLTQALGKLGKNAIACLRQPSMGPVFGIKGGAAGGGFSQVIPMEDINLGFTGDIEKVSAAHNLLAALLDNHIAKGNKLDIDLTSILYPRVMDMNERALRDIVIGLGGPKNGIPRQSGFDISAASEVMAILALAKNYKDLRQRLGRIIIGYSKNGRPIIAEDLQAAGAMAAILKHAIKPNLVQTLEGQACLMHAGPFANIAHGCNSILADEVALRLGDFVLTEAGFGADLGAEKFFDIKCRESKLIPDAVILVSSIRALKMHGGAYNLIPGKPIPKNLVESENVQATKKGCENILKHISNLNKYGIPVIVAINTFHSDTIEEIQTVIEEAKSAGAFDVVQSKVFAEGGKGGIKLAESLIRATEQKSNFKFLYPADMPITQKIETICKEIYGAAAVKYSPLVLERINKYEEDGLGKLSICMAKTHLSLSDNATLKGDPSKSPFQVRIDDIRISAGAGFIYPIAGSMLTMPGLPNEPAANNIDIDENGKITGLF